MILIGNFNSCTKEDSANQTDYNPKDLIKLEELGYIDLWKYYSIEDYDKYTWYHATGTGFKIDYTFVFSKLAATLKMLHLIKIDIFENLKFLIIHPCN